MAVAAAAALLALPAFVAWLVPVWRGQRPLDPVAFAAGPLEVRWYGLLIALSFGPGWLVARTDMKRAAVSPDQVIEATLWAIPLALVGARMGFVLQNLPYFARHPFEALQTWQGGLSIHGAVAGIALAIAWFSRRRKVPATVLADLGAPSVLLGQAIGRWGNFFNRELLGYPTDLPWGLYVPPELRPPGMEGVAFFHPVFLYESLLNAAGAAFLVGWRARRRRWGELGALYLVVYSFNRWLVEWVRIGKPLWLGMTLAQWVSLGLAAMGLVWWMRLRQRA